MGGQIAARGDRLIVGDVSDGREWIVTILPFEDESLGMLLAVDDNQPIVGQRIVGANWAARTSLLRDDLTPTWAKGQFAEPLGRLVDEENVGL